MRRPSAVSRISEEVRPTWMYFESGPTYSATLVRKAITSWLTSASISSMRATSKAAFFLDISQGVFRHLAPFGPDLAGGDFHFEPGSELVLIRPEAGHLRKRVACDHAFLAFSQSARKFFRPISVSGWLRSLSNTANGMVQISAPIMAAWTTCIGWRTEATRTSVVKP